MILSKFGEKMTQKSGILQLMDDLGEALSCGRPVNMLGGGNPAVIPEANEYFQKAFNELGESFMNSAGNYSHPQGDDEFIGALVEFFQRNYGWDISASNIALTNGSQNAFFCLFNLFAGEFSDGSEKKILLPLAPEYIGYSDVHVDGQHFVSSRPLIEDVEYKGQSGFFKYGVDFDVLTVDDSIGAICCSRPTNPTGNVLTDDEMLKLERLAEENNIPFIVDNAYGMPFPNILFSDVELRWTQNMILCLSLSKIGLPGLRTGIIIANERVIEAVSAVNAIVNLSPTRLGAAITTPLVRNDDIQHISDTIIKPFYQQKVDFAISCLKAEMTDLPLKIHRPEGALFLWLWFPDLPVSTTVIYQRLKQLDTIVLPSEHFFPGVADIENYKHSHECIRMSYAQSDETIEKGTAAMAAVIREAYSQV